MYNVTEYDNATNIFSLFIASNNTSNNLFFNGVFIFALFFILFITFKNKYETIVSFLASSFIVSIIAVGGWSLGLTSIGIVFIPVFMLVASVLVYIMSE